MTLTRESSVVETKYVQEAPYEGGTKVDEVAVKLIKRSKTYNIYFLLEFFISYEDMR